jgi:hypothetical protein
MESIVCKLCDNTHLSPSPINERPIHPAMTAIEQAYQAPFASRLTFQMDLMDLVSIHNADIEAGGGGGGIEMEGTWAMDLSIGIHTHPFGAAEA